MNFQNNDVGVRTLKCHGNKQHLALVCGNPAWCVSRELAERRHPQLAPLRSEGDATRRAAAQEGVAFERRHWRSLLTTLSSYVPASLGLISHFCSSTIN